MVLEMGILLEEILREPASGLLVRVAGPRKEMVAIKGLKCTVTWFFRTGLFRNINATVFSEREVGKGLSKFASHKLLLNLQLA